MCAEEKIGLAIELGMDVYHRNGTCRVRISDQKLVGKSVPLKGRESQYFIRRFSDGAPVLYKVAIDRLKVVMTPEDLLDMQTTISKTIKDLG